MKIINYFFVTFFIFSVVPTVSFASTILSINAPDKSLPGREFEVVVSIESSKPINAIEGKIVIPEGVELKGIRDGSSAVSAWINKPTVENKSEIKFSGIFAGGFSGGGQLFVVEVIAYDKKDYPFSAEDFLVYLNMPSPVLDEVSIINSITSITPFAYNKSLNKKDDEAPEAFAIYLTKDPSIFNNSWIVIFDAKDKNSGIMKYQFSEFKGRTISNPDSLKWEDAKSPLLLKDQTLQSFIYIRAIDKEGNERIQVVSPQHKLSWYTDIQLEVVGLLVFLFVVLILIKKKYVFKKNNF